MVLEEGLGAGTGRGEAAVDWSLRPGLSLGGWSLGRRLGGGGFGEVWTARRSPGEQSSPEVAPKAAEVALKVEKRERDKSGAWQTEKEVWEDLGRLDPPKRANWPLWHGAGEAGPLKWIAIEELSINLSELRRQSPKSCFSGHTTAALGAQMLDRIVELHSLGWVHRDIKPSNFMFKLDDKPYKHLCLVDMGLARKAGASGEVRKTTGLVGTVRYASLAAHQGKELSRLDDLISLFYSLLEMSKGCLPWSKVRDVQRALQMKQMHRLGELAKKKPFPAPREMETMGAELERLTEAPPLAWPPLYGELAGLLAAMRGGAMGEEAGWDWDVGWTALPSAALPSRPPTPATATNASHAPTQRSRSQSHPDRAGSRRARRPRRPRGPNHLTHHAPGHPPPHPPPH